jgi:hypothetical protein
MICRDSDAENTVSDTDRNELDPEIAELLGIQEDEDAAALESLGEGGRPIAQTDFRPINLQKVLQDSSSYTKIIGDGGELGQRLHELITNFSKAKDKDERSMYRERIGPAYWNMLLYLVNGFFDDLSSEKQALYRYGLLNGGFISDKQKQVLIHINKPSDSSENLSYVDEWLYKVGTGEVKPSAVDETKKVKKKSTSALKSKMERKSGAREAEVASLKQKIEQHLMVERSLRGSVEVILKHERLADYGGIVAPYSTEQKKTLVQMQETAKSLLKSDRDIEAAFRTLKSLDAEITTIKSQGGGIEEEIDTKTVQDELSTIRQMHKMTVGRQGNHFPFLLKSYMPDNELDTCTKNHLLEALKNIETVDPHIFLRTYKGEEHRIVPNFIIVPSYGDYGICWEPFDRMNKATSKGRIAVPMFPRDLKTSLLFALGDLRWQIAKEKALHYWMEEGLTGYYYQYCQDNKLKGDLKELFIQDYILWIKFESQGMQKLERDVRSIFWRYIPFPQSIKDQLKNRGYYYAELYKKDQNRAMSRGY